MGNPRIKLKAGTDERRDPPEFDDFVPPEELVIRDYIRDDFFDAALGLDSPTTVGETADLAGHGVDAACEHLKWLECVDTVTQITDSPVTYERNQECLNRRRIQQLRN